MTAIHVVSHMDDQQRRAHIFAGDFIVFRQLDAMNALCAWTQALARDAFGGRDPMRAQADMDTESYLAVVAPLQRRFTTDPECRRLYRDALAEAGLDVGKSYWDWRLLRFQPRADLHVSRSTTGLRCHRDTWYGCAMAQNNWWAPVFPIDGDRTVVFYPAYWQRPIANNTEGWDLDDYRAARNKATAANASFEELRKSYREPTVTEPVDEVGGVRFVIEPGDLLCFSSAHLHASVPNSTSLARISTEIRTINPTDILTGQGAPNVDTRTIYKSAVDFRSIDGDHPLTDALVAMPALL